MKVGNKMTVHKEIAGYKEWIQRNEKLQEQYTELPFMPTLAIVILGEPEDASGLKATMESIQAQTYKKYKVCYQMEDVKEAYSICVLPGDTLSCNALYEMVKMLNCAQDYDMIYSDEDCIGEKGVRSNPFFKPDWSPDTQESMDYTAHLRLVRTGKEQEKDWKKVGHISKVLYHNHTGYHFPEAQRKIAVEGNPLVSIVIPSKDNDAVLLQCVKSIAEKTTYQNYEILIVDNGSSEEAKQRIEAMSQEFHCRYLYQPQKFNFSAMCNSGAEAARGDYLLFLNDDIEVVTPEWLELMLTQAQKDHAGAVGAKLLYPDGKIQHVGVINVQGPGHAFYRADDEQDCYFGRNRYNYNWMAVTGACLLVARDKFEKTGRFDENFPIAYNDVDLCFRLEEQGYYQIVCNQVVCIHHESVSRGLDSESEEKQERLRQERENLYEEHLTKEKMDPFYNRNLNREQVDFSFETKRNTEKNICYEIDEIKINQNVVSVMGWAFCYAEDPSVQVRVWDSTAHKEVDSRSYPVTRIDVADIYSCNTEMAGFQLKFRRESGHQYELLLSGKEGFEIADLRQSGKKKNLRKSKFTLHNAYRCFQILNQQGPSALIRKVYNAGKSDGVDYNAWFLIHQPSAQQRKEQKATKFAYQPKISIIVPAFRTPEKYLREMVESVQAQTYENWELCVADGTPDSNAVSDVMQKYSVKDPRIKYKKVGENHGISGNTNAALEMAEGEFISLLDHDDLLSPEALFQVVKKLNEDTEIDVIYTDEDKVSMDSKKHFDPHFKSDYNPDLLRSCNYICHFYVVRKAVADKTGGFQSEYDGAQDYDFIFRTIGNARKVAHIARILYHWRMHPDSTAENPESKMYCYEAGRKAIAAELERRSIPAEVELGDTLGVYRVKYAVSGEPMISILIPNMDHIADLKKCITSIQKKSTWKNYEILIIENNSVQDATFSYYKQLEKNPSVRVVKWQGEGFSYAAICNYGVSQARGEYILLLNNDVEIINGSWMEELLSMCQREGTGIVGARLLYPDHTVQHAGVIVGLGGVAGHAFVGIGAKEAGYFHRARLQQDLSAVTAACLLVSKQLYEEIHGFDENLPVAFNDVDFCLRVREKGYLVVYNPYVELYHYESKSRGLDDNVHKKARFEKECIYFRKKWKQVLAQGDPYYNPNFSYGAPYKIQK